MLLLKLSWTSQRTKDCKIPNILTRQGLRVSPKKQQSVSEPKKQKGKERIMTETHWQYISYLKASIGARRTKSSWLLIAQP